MRRGSRGGSRAGWGGSQVDGERDGRRWVGVGAVAVAAVVGPVAAVVGPPNVCRVDRCGRHTGRSHVLKTVRRTTVYTMLSAWRKSTIVRPILVLDCPYSVECIEDTDIVPADDRCILTEYGGPLLSNMLCRFHQRDPFVFHGSHLFADGTDSWTITPTMGAVGVIYSWGTSPSHPQPVPQPVPNPPIPNSTSTQ